MGVGKNGASESTLVTAPSCVTPGKMLNHSELQSILTQ